jgi:hypothetical protein
VLKSAATSRGTEPCFHCFHASYDASFHDRGAVNAFPLPIGTSWRIASDVGDQRHEASVAPVRISVQ